MNVIYNAPLDIHVCSSCIQIKLSSYSDSKKVTNLTSLCITVCATLWLVTFSVVYSMLNNINFVYQQNEANIISQFPEMRRAGHFQ